MKDNNLSLKELHPKIEMGLKHTFEKLVFKKRKEDGMLVLSKNGKIQKINASNFQL